MAAGTNVGALWWSTSIDFTGFNNSVKGAADNLSPLEKKFNNITAAAEAYLSLQFASRIAKEIINVRGEFQQLGIAFEVMLGSKTKADQLMSEAVTFAQKTPFTLTDVASNIKQLMAMGIATEDVMSTMKALGDVAAGVSVPISRVAINYGQVATLGKLQGRELRDFSMAGIPLMEELAKNLGKSKIEIEGMVSASKIGFKDVEKAFQTMAGEGGKFYNLMERTNSSVTGQVSNLTDKYQVMLNEIGKANEGVIYGGIAGLATLIENYESILDVLKVLVVTYGAYKAALIATAAAQGLMQLVENIRLIGMFRKELGLLTAAQQAFNTTAKANPYGLILAGVTALITAFTVFSDKADEVADAQQRISESINDQKVKIDRLVSTINNVNAAQADRLKAEKDLNDLMPKGTIHLDSRTLSTEKGRLAINDYIKSVRNQMDIEQLESNLRQNLNEQDRIASEKFTVLQGQLYGITREDFEKRKSNEIFLLKEEAEAYAKRRDEIISGGKASNESAKTELTNAQKIEQARKNIADAEARLVELRKPGAKTSTADIQAEVDLIEEQKTLLETLTGEKQKQTKETIGQYDKIQEAIKKTSDTLLNANEKDRAALQQKLAALIRQKQAYEDIIKAQRGETVGMTTTEPVKAKVDTVVQIKQALMPMKQLTEEERKQLKLAAEKADREQEIQEKFGTREEIQQQLVDGAYQYSQELVRQLGLSEQQTNQLSSMVDLMVNLGTGNYISAAFNGLGIVTSLFNQKTEDQSIKALERMNNLLEKQSAILANLSGTNYFQLAKKQYDDLGKQIDDYTKKLRNSQIVIKGGLPAYLKDYSTEDFIKKYTSGILLLNQAQSEWIEAIIKARKEQAELLQETFRESLGFDATDISDSIFDGIEEGLKLGENSLGGFAESFGDFMEKALMQSIIDGMNVKLTEGFLTKYKEFTSEEIGTRKGAETGGKELTLEEIAELERLYAEAIAEGTEAVKVVKGFSEKYKTNETSKSSLVGAIAGASEETMSMVAGQLMAIRVDIKTQLDTGLNHTELMMTANESLRKIELNTRNNAALPDILIELKAMNTELKKGL